MGDSVRAQFDVLDERFRFCKGDASLERLHAGCRWTEGPAYFPAGRYLVFSDIPNDRILRWDETTGAVGAFRQPPATPTVTRSTGRAAWSAASTAAAGSAGLSTTGRSPCSQPLTRASG